MKQPIKFDILVLGAAFDPPHLGHLKMAEEVIKRGISQEVVLMPCRQHPFAKKMSGAEDRLRMVEMMAREHMQVSLLELHRDGVSYAYLTLRQIKADFPTKKIGWLIGSDLVEDFPKWVNYKEILNDFGVVVYPRLGSEKVELLTGMQWVDNVEEVEISSTEIRELIGGNMKWEDKALPAVAAYIKEKGLYGKEG